MRIFIILILLTICLKDGLSQTSAGNFLAEQKRYQRVQTAFSEKDSIVKKLFIDAGARFPEPSVLIRIFKLEKILELWVKAAKTDTMIRLKKYSICATCGDLGPKRRQGDLQIPEGFYHISGFNPVSMFYLSLRINYPNASDRILGVRSNLGGDIFIHGDCVTLGCIPITDDKIKELYIICLMAKSAGNEIPVHIFPFQFNNNYTYVLNIHKQKYKAHLKFWENLKTGYDYFEKYYKPPAISVLPNTGRYIFGE